MYQSPCKSTSVFHPGPLATTDATCTTAPQLHKSSLQVTPEHCRSIGLHCLHLKSPPQPTFIAKFAAQPAPAFSASIPCLDDLFKSIHGPACDCQRDSTIDMALDVPINEASSQAHSLCKGNVLLPPPLRSASMCQIAQKKERFQHKAHVHATLPGLQIVGTSPPLHIICWQDSCCPRVVTISC